MPHPSVNRVDVFENVKEWGDLVSTVVVISVDGRWPRSTNSRVEDDSDFIMGSATVLFTLSLG